MLTVLWQNCLQPYKISIDFPEEDAHKTSMESNGMKILILRH